MGPEVAEAENKLAAFAGVSHCITCASGTDALLMALMAWDVEPGDAIFTTPFTFMATAEVVSLLGATPFFVDIDPGTFNMDPAKLPAAIAKAEKEGYTPRGIMPVDLFGLPADHDAIQEIATAHGLFVLDDACQGFGGVYKGKRIGSIGGISATSFFPAKPLGVYGDGGALFTDDPALAAKLRSIRIHGMGPDKYDNVRIGINGRFDTLQAAILLPKLEIFPEELELRQKIAVEYTALVKDAAQLQIIPGGYQSAWAQYCIVSPHKAKMVSALHAAGIPTAVYYPIPLHLQQAYKFLGHRVGDFPVCEAVAKNIFAVPMHPYLEKGLIEEIAGIIQTAARG